MIEELKDQLNRIERLTLLGAKTVLNIDDVCLLTGLCKSKIYKLTSSKEIPHYKPNGKIVYFDREEINDWLKQNRISTNDEIESLADTYLATGKITQ